MPILPDYGVLVVRVNTGLWRQMRINVTSLKCPILYFECSLRFMLHYVTLNNGPQIHEQMTCR